MSQAHESPSENIAPLLRLGLEGETQMMDPNATFAVPAPTQQTEGNSGAGSRGWNPPSVEELQKLLPQYEISAFIARGGMGAVYKGQQKTLKRPVAIKVLPPDLEDGDLQFAARFKHEAQAMAHLSHPNIVAVFDAGETADGLLYFVMEFIQGTDVAQLIASEGQLDPRRAIQITTAVCEALAFAHEEGIIHRDIKPSNIMIDRKGRVKVADFGLAKTMNLEHSLMTGSNVALGTPDFIAPETLIPGMKVDGRADIYAVGVMLYQMLTGTIPRGRFELPSGVVPQVNKGFDAVVDKAMQTDREKRYSTAMEMKTAVEAAGARSEDTSSRADPSGSAAAKRPEEPGKTEASPRAKTVKVPMITVAAMVLALGIGAWSQWGNKNTPSTASPNASVSSASPNASVSSASPNASVSSPSPHQWTKFWTSERMKKGAVEINGDWLRSPQAGHHPGPFTDMGVRVRFRGRRGEKGDYPQLNLREGNGQGNVIHPNFEIDQGGDRFRIRSTEPDFPTLASAPITPPLKPGQEYQVEFYAIGRTLIARLDGQTITAQWNGPIHASGFDSTSDVYFRDFEYINLDGIPEAEALKLAGAASAPALKSSTTSSSPPSLWVNVTARLMKQTDVSSGTDGWLKSAAPYVAVPDFSARNAGFRCRFQGSQLATASWPSLTLRETKSAELSSGFQVKIGAPAGDTLEVFRLDAPTRSMIKLASQPLPSPMPRNEEFTLEIYTIGHTVIARCRGQTVVAPIDQEPAEHGLGAAFWNLPSDGFKSCEVLNLDGMSEAEALKFAGEEGRSESGQWRNLIPLIDPSHHTITGNWTVQNGALVCKAAAWALCELPIDYHGGNYELRFSVTRGEGQRLAMYFPFRKGDAAGDVVFDYFQGFADGMKRAGLENIDGHKLNDPGSVFRLKPEWIPPGQKSTVLMQVRDEGIAVSLNGKEVFRWKADWAHLHQRYGFEHVAFAKLNERPVFGVGLFSCDATYHSIEMRDVNGPEGFNLPPALKQAGETAAAPQAETTFAGHRYLVLKDKLPWGTAKAKAEAMGGHLATISSQEEWAAVQKVLSESEAQSGKGEFWLGGEANAAGVWSWVTGEPFAFTAWTDGRPDKDGHHWTIAKHDPGRGSWAWWDFHDAAEPELSKGIQAHIGGYVIEWDTGAGASASVAPEVYPKGVWTAAWPLVKDSHGESLQVTRFDANGSWMEPNAQSGGTLLDPRARLRNAAVRATFRSGGDAFFLAQIVLRSTQQPPWKTYILRLSQSGSSARVLFHDDGISKDSSNERTLRDSRLEKPVLKGDSYTLEMACIGHRLIARCNGQLIADIEDSALSEGTHGIRSGEAFRDWEIMNLDGLSEAEALKLAGVSSISNSPAR